MIKAANAKYLTKENLGLENAMNLEEIVRQTENRKLRQKIDDLNVILDQEKVSVTINDLREIKNFSLYNINAEKVKYQQVLNFKIEGLVNHLVKKNASRKLDEYSEKSELRILENFYL